MLRLWFLLLLSVVLPPAATSALAQVTVDLHALQALPGQNSPPTPTRVAPRPTQRPPPRVESPTTATEKSSTASVASANPTGNPTTQLAVPQPALPRSAPETAAISPVAPAPESAPPPPPTVSDKAATTAEPTSTGLRLTFAPGQSELTPDSVTSLKKLADTVPAGETVSFNVMAYAPGSADDPSTARRISLSRAMAVRSALVNNGVSSARIYVRALGEQYGSGPPDRVDVSVLASNGGSQNASQATPK